MQKISNTLNKLEEYIEKENYKGYDPYDLLKSPLFKLPFFKSNKTIRFFLQQLGKRSPINLRSFFLVPKGYNPVALGLFIEGYSYLSQVFPEHQEKYLNKIKFLLNKLEKLIPTGFSGACWGYDFDWEARYANIPAYQPTVVATGIITNSLFQYYKLFNDEKAFAFCKSATDFILKDLQRTYKGEEFCFSYSPFDKQVVFNASMKAVRNLVQVYSVTKDPILIDEASKAVNFVVDYQKEDGSWVYSEKLNNRIDNYHTGYVLSCLKEYSELADEKTYDKNIELGLKFYKENFIKKDGIPKFYNTETFPIDCTSAAQTILTFTKFQDIKNSIKVANFMIENMFSKNGYFYFRRFKNYLIKIPMMRWSQAWMFAALSYLLFNKLKNK